MSSKMLFILTACLASLSVANAATPESTATKFDQRSQALAQALQGRAIRCVSSENSNPGDGAFSDLVPLTIRAENKGRATVISIEGRNGQSFAASGEYLTVEYSENHMILKDGDDGWNELAIEMNPSELGNTTEMPAILSFLSDDGVYDSVQPLTCTVENP